MPVMVPAPRQASNGQADVARPRQFVIGESSGSQRLQPAERWDVDHFRKNGGEIFYGNTDPEVALDWLETVRVVLTDIGFPAELWVCMATGAMQQEGRAWWDTIHFRHFKSRALEQVSWAEFRDVFYDQYFSNTIWSLKKQEFLFLHKDGSTSVAEYQARFLRLERFVYGSFASKRE